MTWHPDKMYPFFGVKTATLELIREGLVQLRMLRVLKRLAFIDDGWRVAEMNHGVFSVDYDLCFFILRTIENGSFS